MHGEPEKPLPIQPGSYLQPPHRGDFVAQRYDTRLDLLAEQAWTDAHQPGVSPQVAEALETRSVLLSNAAHDSGIAALAEDKEASHENAD